MKFLLLPLFMFMFMSLPAFAELDEHTSEYQLVNLINQFRRQQNLTPLLLERQASDVARQHSNEMRISKFFDLTSPTRGSINNQLAYSRVSGRSQHAFIAIDYDVQGLLKQLKKNPALLSEESTHIAIGITSGEHPEYGQALWATVILLESMAQLDSIPRTLEANTTLTFKATLSSGYKSPRVPITFPNGKVQTFFPISQNQSQFDFQIPLGGEAGRYTLELLVEKPGSGPKVASILPFYVGREYPLKEKMPVLNKQQMVFKNTNEASLYLFKQINQEREKHDLAKLESDSRLNYVAYKHSEDMAKRHFFAHTNPDGLNPNQRFLKQGGIGPVGENIVSNRSIEIAHHHLMNSPGHRENILDPKFTHLGIGIYYSNENFYITQLFQQKNRSINPQTFHQGILSWLSDIRIQKQLQPLQEEKLMSKTALEHSRAMSTHDRLAYAIQNLNFAERFTHNGGHYNKLNTLVLTADSYDDAISKLKKQEKMLTHKNRTKVGIGILQANSRSKGENIIWITLALADE